jgi:hypothetical protein
MPMPFATKSAQLLIQDSGGIPSVPRLIRWLLENYDTILQLRDIDPNAIAENYVEQHQDEVISLLSVF